MADAMPRPTQTNAVGAAEGSWLVHHAGCGLHLAQLLLTKEKFYNGQSGVNAARIAADWQLPA